jgi:hypothetical protein
MISKTKFTVDPALFKDACNHLPKGAMKTTINEPTSDFFYDPWVIKAEYKGTVWETLYNSLPVTKGEARIIILDPGQCYQIHADIDDRYHLNVLGDNSYLIDLVRETMHPLSQDGIWYDMDASFLHTATNFGRRARVQLVVRKLLKNNKLKNPVEVSLATSIENPNHARFLFDNTMSPWFNEANKLGFINSFVQGAVTIKFNIEQDRIQSLKRMLPSEFIITFNN